VVVTGFFVWCKERGEESEDEFCGERRSLSEGTGENGGERKVGVVDVEGHCQGRVWSGFGSAGIGIVTHSPWVRFTKFNFAAIFFPSSL
jgi:hypothetical protein